MGGQSYSSFHISYEFMKLLQAQLLKLLLKCLRPASWLYSKALSAHLIWTWLLNIFSSFLSSAVASETSAWTFSSAKATKAKKATSPERIRSLIIVNVPWALEACLRLILLQNLWTYICLQTLMPKDKAIILQIMFTTTYVILVKFVFVLTFFVTISIFDR